MKLESFYYTYSIIVLKIDFKLSSYTKEKTLGSKLLPPWFYSA